MMELGITKLTALVEIALQQDPARLVIPVIRIGVVHVDGVVRGVAPALPVDVELVSHPILPKDLENPCTRIILEEIVVPVLEPRVPSPFVIIRADLAY
jgi:hypothetical protein